MNVIELKHFERAAADIASYGDNDTLPFDIENTFIKENQSEIAAICLQFFEKLEITGVKDAINIINETEVLSERLLVPVGSTGFRITTKIHPFWNLYFNGLGTCIAEKLNRNVVKEPIHIVIAKMEQVCLTEKHLGGHTFRQP